jgi:NADP-dependent 3-hydroxy acid dehydrogenase YdfG
MAMVVVVTGASAGVGRATVEEFAKHGYDVALLARDPDRLERVAAEGERGNGDCVRSGVQADRAGGRAWNASYTAEPQS